MINQILIIFKRYVILAVICMTLIQFSAESTESKNGIFGNAQSLTLYYDEKEGNPYFMEPFDKIEDNIRYVSVNNEYVTVEVPDIQNVLSKAVYQKKELISKGAVLGVLNSKGGKQTMLSISWNQNFFSIIGEKGTYTFNDTDSKYRWRELITKDGVKLMKEKIQQKRREGK